MARMINPVYFIYIADGLAEDYEDLLSKCAKVSKLSYEKFCEIWRETNFVCIFHGRPTEIELAEFSEETLHLAKYFMVSNINNYEKAVASLFLIYALLNLQPFPGFAALRLDPQDVPIIKHIELVARKERRHDILYILGQVLIKGRCQFHVSARERALEFCFRKYFEDYPVGGPMGIRPKGVLRRHNEEVDLLQELKYLEKCYKSAKAAVAEKHDSGRSLSYTNDSFGVSLESTLKDVVGGLWNMEKDADESASTEATDKDSPVTSLKSRAMRGVVNPMKHLQSVEERKTKSKTKSIEINTSRQDKRKSEEIPARYHWSLKNIVEQKSNTEPTEEPTQNAAKTDDFYIDLSVASDKEEDNPNENTASNKNSSKDTVISDDSGSDRAKKAPKKVQVPFENLTIGKKFAEAAFQRNQSRRRVKTGALEDVSKSERKILEKRKRQSLPPKKRIKLSKVTFETDSNSNSDSSESDLSEIMDDIDHLDNLLKSSDSLGKTSDGLSKTNDEKSNKSSKTINKSDISINDDEADEIIFPETVNDKKTNKIVTSKGNDLIGIEFNKLPVVINTDTKGMPFEIEIIDEYQGDSDVNRNEGSSKVVKDFNEPSTSYDKKGVHKGLAMIDAYSDESD